MEPRVESGVTVFTRSINRGLEANARRSFRGTKISGRVSRLNQTRNVQSWTLTCTPHKDLLRHYMFHRAKWVMIGRN